MEKTLLSLKNLYRLLTTDDFPSYAESVFGSTHRKGLTLGRFWNSAVSEELRSIPKARLIWKNDGKRSRYYSQLINRSEELPFYKEYVRELASRIDETIMALQIRRFQAILRDRCCRFEALHRRIEEILPLWEKMDRHVSDSMSDLFRGINEESSEMKRFGEEGELFHASYLLSVLTLYALAGDCMDDPAMQVLEDERFSLRCCSERMNKKAVPDKSARYLTVYNSNLQGDVLPSRRFFGREEELYDLQEMVLAGRKCLLSGIGGIGKTELVRQLLKLLAAENLVDEIAVVQYGSDLIDSFSRSFAVFPAAEPEEGFNEALFRLEKDADKGKRVLLLVDDLTKDTKQDIHLKKLADLSISVVITSRLAFVEGFETYMLSTPSITAGTLIFRDNYSRPIEREDVRLLQDYMKSELLCHPLTLRLLAHTASDNDQPLNFIEQFLASAAAGSFTDSIKKVYDRLYSKCRIPKEMQTVISLMTLLPYEQYEHGFLEKVFPDIFGSMYGDSDKIPGIINGGWLSGGIEGISMHPLIAECLRKRIRPEDKLNMFLDPLALQLPDPEEISIDDYQDTHKVRCAKLYLYLCDEVTGPVSRKLVRNMFAALELPYPYKSAALRYAKLVEKLKKRCADWGDYEEIKRLSFLAKWETASKDELLSALKNMSSDIVRYKNAYDDMLLNSSHFLSLRQENEKAEELLDTVLAGKTAPYRHATAMLYKFQIYQVESDFDRSVKQIEETLAYVREHPEVGAELYLQVLASHGQMCLSYGKAEETMAALTEIEQRLGEFTAPSVLLMYGQLKGMYETYFGDPEKGLEVLREHCDRLESYVGKNHDYYNVRISIATVLQRLKRYEESIEAYGEAYAFAENNNNDGMIHLCGNNMAVAYLEMDRPEDAMKYLEPSVRIARSIGGLGLGEVLKNMARAYGQMEDYIKEKECLTEAVPILLEAYGEDNPRSAQAKARLEELNTSLK